MPPSVEKVLEIYGLNKKEAKFYLASLVLGMANVAEIAKKAGLKRTTLYSLVDELEAKGLIKKATRRKKFYLIAESPENLLAKLEKELEVFKKSLPQFKSLQAELDTRPKIIFYQGREGFKRIWQEILKSDEKEYLIITSAKEFLNFLGEKYIEKDIIQEKIKLGISSRQIITDSIYARKIMSKDKQENRQSKMAPPNHPFPATEIIFGNKVAVFSSRFENILMIIESEDIAKSRKSNFEIIWQLLK